MGFLLVLSGWCEAHALALCRDLRDVDARPETNGGDSAPVAGGRGGGSAPTCRRRRVSLLRTGARVARRAEAGAGGVERSFQRARLRVAVASQRGLWLPNWRTGRPNHLVMGGFLMGSPRFGYPSPDAIAATSQENDRPIERGAAHVTEASMPADRLTVGVHRSEQISPVGAGEGDRRYGQPTDHAQWPLGSDSGSNSVILSPCVFRLGAGCGGEGGRIRPGRTFGV